jgi:hypothetical protein
MIVVRLGDAARDVLAPLIADLRTTNELDLGLDPDDEFICMVTEPDGSGSALGFGAHTHSAEWLAATADQLQDIVIDARRSVGLPVTWPECPSHPATHPLSPVVDAGGAVWVCRQGGNVRIPIGTLADS